jgi:hypothetical protein
VSAEGTATSAPSAAAAEPDDANDLRGHYFKLLLRKPLTQALVAAAAIAGGIAGAAIVGPGVGAAAFFGGLLIALLIVFGIADSRSEDAFFDSYAGQRQMTAAGKGPLPPVTPLLRKGDDRYAVRTLTGPLADGVDGMLALYTYETTTSNGRGQRQTHYSNYTVGLAEVPECVELLPELYCQRKSGLRALEGFEDAFRGSKKRVELESAALDERYEIFANEGQDQTWLRRLFSPTFIVWLGEEAPEKFAFELVDGALCCYVGDHRKRAHELDTVRAASAAVAKRLREEALE